jgi:hypothetical protein
MRIKYVAVFDLDETLGNFEELSIFWSITNSLCNNKLINEHFNFIIDNNKEILRYKILKLLKILKKKKQTNKCHGILIYTNNNGENSWANYIKDYFHDKLNYKLFDQIIRAYKIDNRKVELNRTSHDKSYTDFVKCTTFNTNTQVCFLDDKLHKEMQHKNVTYIKLNPYYCNFDYIKACTSFYNSYKKLFKCDYNTYIRSFSKYNSLNKNISNTDYENDYTIIYNIFNSFFDKTKTHNKKTYNNKKHNNKTLKK